MQVSSQFLQASFQRQTHLFCKEDSYELKLYEQGAAASLANSVKILLLREAAKWSCKSQRQQSLRVSHSEVPSKTLGGDHSSQAARTVDIAITSTPLDGGIHQRQTPDATSETNWGIFP